MNGCNGRKCELTDGVFDGEGDAEMWMSHGDKVIYNTPFKQYDNQNLKIILYNQISSVFSHFPPFSLVVVSR